MAFKYIFVFSALVVLAQGSDLSPVEHEPLDGTLHSGVGASHGRPAVSHGQRPGGFASGHGSINYAAGGSHRLGGSGIGGSRSHGAGPRRQSGGSHNRPAGGIGHGHGGRPIGGGAGHGNAHKNHNRNQKPY